MHFFKDVFNYFSVYILIDFHTQVLIISLTDFDVSSIKKNLYPPF
jgi:hypothetical protein